MIPANLTVYIIYLSMSLSELISPFENLECYLRAVKIIHSSYSVKTQNYDEVCLAIDQQMKSYYANRIIRNFIDNVLLYRDYSGINFFDSEPVGSSNHILNKVLTPNVDICVFCTEPSRLVIKKIRLLKEPILYKNEGIGNVPNFVCPKISKKNFFKKMSV